MMNEYYIVAPTDDELYHHGILGQKWGKQNGPPYPLGSGSHSAAEKKAGWQKSLKSGAKKLGKGMKKVASGIKKHAPGAIDVGKGAVKKGSSAARSAADSAFRFGFESALTGGPAAVLIRRAVVKAYKKAINSPNVTTAKQRNKMSDEELTYKIGRLEQETKLRRLERENIDTGRVIVNDVGKKVAITALTGAALYAGKSVISKEFSAKELGDAVFRGGAKKNK